MLYYRVKPQHDNAKLSRDFQILIGTELYTPREMAIACKKWKNRNTRGEMIMPTQADIDNFLSMFDAVVISSAKTYWMFGARFAEKEVTQW